MSQPTTAKHRDDDILDLYFARDERAIRETDGPDGTVRAYDYPVRYAVK